jgi:hypothetical protein
MQSWMGAETGWTQDLFGSRPHSFYFCSIAKSEVRYTIFPIFVFVSFNETCYTCDLHIYERKTAKRSRRQAETDPHKYRHPSTKLTLVIIIY